jgi:predicted DNA binding CopG/RHH family protein
MNMTDGETRRVGTYHTGIETRVVGVRMPVDKIEAVKAIFAKQGLTMSEGMERVVDTQILRTR